MRYARAAVPERLIARFDVVTPPTSDPTSFALSPDGRQLAFLANVDGDPRIWVRPLDRVMAQSLVGTEGASHPFWAPDGRAIGFFAGGKLKRVDLAGGAARSWRTRLLNVAARGMATGSSFSRPLRSVR